MKDIVNPKVLTLDSWFLPPFSLPFLSGANYPLVNHPLLLAVAMAYGVIQNSPKV